MGTGYTRNDTGNNIANGNVIDADDLDGEFNALVAAFDGSTGHSHDGTTGEGPPISVTGPGQEYLSDATALYPKADDTYDLGKVGAEWKDLYVDGTGNIDSLVSGSVDINGGSIDGTVIGGSTAAAIDGTTITASIGFVGDLTGNVTGNLTGNVTGDLTGNADSATTLTGLTSTISELNILDGVTATTAEINYLDITTLGTSEASKVVTADGGGNVVLDGDVVLDGKVTLGAEVVETVHTLSGTTAALDPANGTIQTHTLSANSTYTDSFANGESITLMVNDGAGYSVSWPTITWINNAGVDPTLATSGYTVVVLWKVSGTLYGALAGDGS